MNRSDLTSSVAARTSVPGADADRVVAKVFATIAEALARGEKVPIAGFGNFATRSRAVRHGRNPATGESIAIAASTLPSFKAGKTLREVVNARKVLTRPDAVRIAVTGDRYRLYRYPSGNVLPRRAHHRAGRHQHHSLLDAPHDGEKLRGLQLPGSIGLGARSQDPARATNCPTSANHAATATAMTSAARISSDTWRRLARAHLLGARLGEETLTDLLALEMLHFQNSNAFRVFHPTRHQESCWGADLLVWIRRRSGLTRFLAIQAKKLYPNGRYTALNHHVSPGVRQIDLLDAFARQYRAIPLYLLFNHFDSGNPAAYWHCCKPFDIEQLGCTLVPKLENRSCDQATRATHLHRDSRDCPVPAMALRIRLRPSRGTADGACS